MLMTMMSVMSVIMFPYIVFPSAAKQVIPLPHLSLDIVEEGGEVMK